MIKLYDRSISTFRENGKTIGLIGLTIPLLLENTDAPSAFAFRGGLDGTFYAWVHLRV